MAKRIPIKKKRGRQKNVPNLKRTTTGSYINQHGVEITDAEKRHLESLVNSINRRRKKQLEDEAKLPRGNFGTIGDLQLMGHESDIILARRSKSVQRFASRKEFETYMKGLEKVNSPGYMDERIRMYKRNYMKALDDNFGSEAKDIKMKIRMMKPKDYMKAVQGNEDLEFGHLYTAEEVAAKLNAIRAALGMKVKEIPYDE